MLVTTHSLVAMTVAVKTGNPYIYLPFAAIDHYLLDQAPHFGFKRFTLRKFYILTFFDVLFGFAALFAVMAITKWSFSILFFLCLLAGWPDIFWFVREKRNGFLERFKQYHKKIQRLESHFGILVELMVIVICFYLLTH